MTLVTTTAAGSILSGNNPLSSLNDFFSGLPFSLTLMGILTLHEIGHLLAARWHGLPFSPPYFIPAPTLIGTFGAIIRMPPVSHTRKSLFDIGISGPLAGLFPSLIALGWGLHLSRPDFQPDSSGIGLGESILFHYVSTFLGPSLGSHQSLVLSPIGFAGWTGLFVTALNLIPVGQLDGSHFLFVFWKQHIHRFIWIVILATLAWMGFFYWEGWWVWFLFALLMGPKHFPVSDPDEPLGKPRVFLAIFMIFLEILIFVPSPFTNH